MRLPLEEVNFGPCRYRRSEENGIELIYRPGSTYLSITTGAGDTNSFVLRGITALELALVEEVPGVLETMGTRLTIETTRDVIYQSKTKASQRGRLNCRLVVIRAGLNMASDLRNTMLHFKEAQNLSRDSPYPRDSALGSQGSTFEVLPIWASYVPRRLYSRNLRIVLQKLILTYTALSVIWACWQLYRHVSVIHMTFQPFIEILWFYLSSAMEAFDTIFVVLTKWWTDWVSPLSIFLGAVLTPVIRMLRITLVPLWYTLATFGGHLYQLFSTLSAQVLLKRIWSLLFNNWVTLVNLARMLINSIMQPIQALWLVLVNSQVAVTSLDTSRIQSRWIIGLVTSSSRSIWTGMIKLVHYFHVSWKRKAQLLRSPTRTSMDAPSEEVTHNTPSARVAMEKDRVP